MRVDYWKFNYKDVITVENAQGKLNADPDADYVSFRVERHGRVVHCCQGQHRRCRRGSIGTFQPVARVTSVCAWRDAVL